MDSERVTRQLRRIRGPKQATSALNKIERLASTNNRPKPQLSRSGPNNTESPLQGIRWECELCGLQGTTYPEETASIVSLTSSIQFDHARRSPECSNGDNGIHIIPRRTPRQWLSSSSA